MEGNEEGMAEDAAECPVEVIIASENDFDLIVESEEDDGGSDKRNIEDDEL